MKIVKINIHGMHCRSCEILLERELKTLPGVKKVNVSHAKGIAVLHSYMDLDMGTVKIIVEQNGYELMRNGEEKAHPRKEFLELGGIFLIVFGLFFMIQHFNMLSQGYGVTEDMSYGFVFILGLVAAFSSCIAVVGGLLVAISAKYSEQHQNYSSLQKFRPHIYFNMGRLVSYTLLGGTIGALGSLITLSPFITGVISLLVSIIMILLGFQLLKLFPTLTAHLPKMPKWVAHKIHDASEKKTKGGAFSLGALTFFLPCGFTQALQLYVLSRSDVMTGALTMFVFALGTLPALLSLGVLSSFAKGNFQKYFLKTAGILVVLVGLVTFQSGMTLTGIPAYTKEFFGQNSSTSTTMNVAPADMFSSQEKQVVRMKIVGLEYEPAQFTVRKGVPVEWEIDASRAIGCARVISVPSLGITEMISGSKKVISFVPQSEGIIPFSCSMGMTTPGASFKVVSNS